MINIFYLGIIEEKNQRNLVDPAHEGENKSHIANLADNFNLDK
jgi:hypothetical protein